MLKKIALRALDMCDAAYIVMKLSVILSCISLSAALACWLSCKGPTVESYYAYCMARELTNLPFALLLLGVILSVCLEDRFQGTSLR